MDLNDDTITKCLLRLIISHPGNHEHERNISKGPEDKYGQNECSRCSMYLQPLSSTISKLS